jgi:hypothetical protein
MHVDSELNWGADPQKVLKQGAVLGQGYLFPIFIFIFI